MSPHIPSKELDQIAADEDRGFRIARAVLIWANGFILTIATYWFFT